MVEMKERTLALNIRNVAVAPLKSAAGASYLSRSLHPKGHRVWVSLKRSPRVARQGRVSRLIDVSPSMRPLDVIAIPTLPQLIPTQARAVMLLNPSLSSLADVASMGCCFFLLGVARLLDAARATSSPTQRWYQCSIC